MLFTLIQPSAMIHWQFLFIIKSKPMISKTTLFMNIWNNVYNLCIGIGSLLMSMCTVMQESLAVLLLLLHIWWNCMDGISILHWISLNLKGLLLSLMMALWSNWDNFNKKWWLILKSFHSRSKTLFLLLLTWIQHTLTQRLLAHKKRRFKILTHVLSLKTMKNIHWKVYKSTKDPQTSLRIPINKKNKLMTLNKVQPTAFHPQKEW